MYETWLRSFHAVAHHQGFTAAAKALNLSQPTITEQVRALEGKFGVELFHRRGRAIRLTDEGASLYEITQGMAGHVAEAISFLDGAARPAGRLAIGSVNPYHVMPTVKAFRDAFPEVDTALNVDHRRAVLDGLLDFRFDVALIGRRESDPRLACTPLGRHRVEVLMPAGHPLARRRRLVMADLDGQAMVLREARSTTRLAFERAARKAGIKTRTVMEIDSREAIREAVALDMGLGLVAAGETLPGDRLIGRPVDDADMTVDFHVASLRNRAQRPLIAAFEAIATAESGAA